MLRSDADADAAMRIDVTGFKVDLLRKVQTPICTLCESQQETEEERERKRFLQYEIDSVECCSTRGVWYRVLWRNRVYHEHSNTGAPMPPLAFKGSLLGPTGHLERMNAWSHIFAALLYLAYLPVRLYATPMGRETSLSSTLAAVSYASFVGTFALSVVYHVYSPNVRLSAVTRIFDYFGIYAGIACGALSDLSTTTLNLQNVPAQSVADIFGGGVLIVAFFVVRRVVLPIEETRRPVLAQKCSLGFGRMANVDLEHSSLRAAAGIALAFGWILTIPGAFETLEVDCAWMFAGSRFVGTGVLIAGMAWDNVVAFPDVWYENDEKPGSFVCWSNSSRPGCGGCVVSSHTLWHFLALLSTVITSVGTEYVIAASEVLR